MDSISRTRNNWRRHLPMALLALSLTSFGSVASAAPSKDKPMVAVLYFDYDSADEFFVLRKGLAEMLIADLSPLESVGFVERERLQEVLAELDLQQTPRFDQKTAAKVGKLLGARYLVLGSYFVLLGTLGINAALVDVETGVRVHTASAKGPAEDFLGVEQNLSANLSNFIYTRLPQLARPSTPATPNGHTKKSGEAKLARKTPKKMNVKTALSFSSALEAGDKGNKAAAIEHLKKVMAEEPDFQLAKEKYEKLSLN